MKVSGGKNWINGCSKYFERLAEGRKKDNRNGTNTLFFIHRNKLPKNKKPTYLCICAIFLQQKEDPYRVRSFVCGNIFNYQGETYTPTTDLTTTKLLCNSVISTNRVRFNCIDLSKFYLFTPFNNKSDYEYVWIP